MQAKVKDSYRFKILNTFNRVEFIKGEWRAVPPGFEAQAEAHEDLDTRADVVEVIEVEEATPAAVELGEALLPIVDNEEETEAEPTEETTEEESPKKRARRARS